MIGEVAPTSSARLLVGDFAGRLVDLPCSFLETALIREESSLLKGGWLRLSTWEYAVPHARRPPDSPFAVLTLRTSPTKRGHQTQRFRRSSSGSSLLSSTETPWASAAASLAPFAACALTAGLTEKKNNGGSSSAPSK